MKTQLMFCEKKNQEHLEKGHNLVIISAIANEFK